MKFPVDKKCVEDLPLDLLIEILSRLPVKELGKLRCISKQWYGLFTRNKEFTAWQREHAKVKPLLLLRKYSSNFFVEVQKHKVVVELISVDMEGTVMNKFRTVVSGPVHTFISSGGLAIFCCMNSLYVLNPSTRETISIPPSSSVASFYTIGFGYLPRSNEYKIIHLFFNSFVGDGNMGSEVLSLRDGEGVSGGCWKPVGVCPFNVSSSDCLCVNGVVFWDISRPCTNEICRRQILSFDLEKEEFNAIDYPKTESTMYGSLALTGIQEKVSIVGLAAEISGMVDIWMLKNINDGTWVMEYRVNLFSIGGLVLIPADNYSGDILLINSEQKGLMRYSTRDQTMTNVCYSGNIEPHRRPCLYCEHLFSLHKSSLVSSLIGNSM